MARRTEPTKLIVASAGAIAASQGHGRTRLLLPRPGLASCIFAAIVRDTRGRVLSDAERLNFFPATPFCSLSWFFEGSASFIGTIRAGPPHEHKEPLPRIVFTGPHRQPTVSMSNGPLAAMTVSFFPEAISAMFDLDISGAVDTVTGVGPGFNEHLATLVSDVLSAGSPEAGFDLLQDHLLPIWRAERPSEARTTRWISDWARTVAARAAFTGAGRSVRQAQRRFRRLTAQSERDIDAHARLEHLFADALQQLEQGKVDWAGAAAGAGYADQSHLVRQVRQATGFTPDDLRRRMAHDEAFWCYRLLGERF